MKVKQKNKFGQYFTPGYVVDFMLSLSHSGTEIAVLEPSSGTGAFLDALSARGYDDITGIELDEELIQARHADFVFNGSFVSWPVTKKFDLVIGNPPYIRWKNLEEELKQELDGNELWNTYCNKLCDYSSLFIIKAVESLKEGGELIFITPEYWLTTTHAAATRSYLMQHGVLDSIYLFGEAPFFEKASVSTVVFKYVKTLDGRLLSVVRNEKKQKWDANLLALIHQRAEIKGFSYFSLPQFKGEESWVLSPTHRTDAFRDYERQCVPKSVIENGQGSLFANYSYSRVGDMCHVANGMVSGLDEAFQLPPDLLLTPAEELYTIRVAKARHLAPYAPVGSTRYLLLPTGTVESEEALRRDYPNFYSRLRPFKGQLLERYAYAKPAAYWEWSFLRNYSLLSRPCARLLVPCKERVTNKDFFRFSYASLGVFATQDVTALVLKDGARESIEYVLAMLNNPRVFSWLTANGIIKGGIVEFSEKPINSIPIRRINWNVPGEVILHEKITRLTERLIESNTDSDLLAELYALTDSLLAC